MSVAGACGAFALGLSSSVGPCAAPRYLALAGTIAQAGARRRWLRALTFLAGLATSYAALGCLGVFFAAVLAASHLLYLGLAVAFIASGVAMTVVRRDCDHLETGERFSEPLFAGIACGLVVSPCCTPMVLEGSLMAASGSVWAAAVTLSAFLLGHTAPLAAAAASGDVVLNRIKAVGALDAVSIVAAGCTIALGMYYGCEA